MTRLTSRASRSWTPVCPGPGPQPQHRCRRPIHGLDCTGTSPCKPPDCFPSHGAPAGASAVTTKSSGSSAAATGPTWSNGPDSNVCTGHPEPQPPEPCRSATLPHAPHGDAGHAISAGTTGPHPHRQGTRCVPTDHPASTPASNPSPVWASGWSSPGGASVCCCGIDTLFFHPVGGWSGVDYRGCAQFPGVTRHISEYRPQTSAKPVRWTSSHDSYSQPAASASTAGTECRNSQSQPPAEPSLHPSHTPDRSCQPLRHSRCPNYPDSRAAWSRFQPLPASYFSLQYPGPTQSNCQPRTVHETASTAASTTATAPNYSPNSSLSAYLH